MLGPVFYAGVALSIVLMAFKILPVEHTANSRNNMVTISAFYYFLTAGLFNTQFLRDSFIRVVLFVVSQSAALVVRVD